jgi:HK97 family phage major capsid protein
MLLDTLQQRRTETRAAADEIITRAADEQRDLTAAELADHQAKATQLREIEDEIERRMAEELAELRAAGARTPSEVEHRGGHALAAEIRALTTASPASFSPSEYASYFFDRLSATSVALRSGIRVIRTSRDSLVVPTWTTDTTSAWTSEAGTISSTDAAASSVTATPRKLAALQPVSNESLADANPSLLDAVSAGLVRSVGLKFDLGVYEGSGSAPEIRGLKNVVGITLDSSLGAAGAVPTTLDPVATAIGSLLTANAGDPVIVMHPRTWGTLIKIKEGTGSNKPVLQDSAGSGAQGVTRSIYGVPVYLSSQLSITETKGASTDCSSIYVYDPNEVIAVVREDVRVEIDSSRLFNTDQTELRAIMRADVVVPNPTAVVRIEGVRA